MQLVRVVRLARAMDEVVEPREHVAIDAKRDDRAIVRVRIEALEVAEQEARDGAQLAVPLRQAAFALLLLVELAVEDGLRVRDVAAVLARADPQPEHLG